MAELWLKSGQSYIYQHPTLTHPYNWRTTGLNLAPAYNSATELQPVHWVGVMNNGRGLVTVGWSLWVLQCKHRDSTGSCVSQIFPGQGNRADYNQKPKGNSTVSFRTVSDSLREHFPIPDMNTNIIPFLKNGILELGPLLLCWSHGKSYKASIWLEACSVFQKVSPPSSQQEADRHVTRAAAESFTSWPTAAVDFWNPTPPQWHITTKKATPPR